MKIKKSLRKRNKSNIFYKLMILITICLAFYLNLNFKKQKNFINSIKNSNLENLPTANKPNIGDIVYYNHIDPDDIFDKAKQKISISKGNPKKPGFGTGVYGDNPKDQIIDLKSYEQKINSRNTTWRVWDIIEDATDPNNYSLVLISNQTPSYLETGGPIGYLWWPNLAHKMASVYGYGFGADTKATSGFKYSVGSKIDTAPDMTEGDKGIWKIGTDGTNISGARSFTIEDIEDKLGITEDRINQKYLGLDTNFVPYKEQVKNIEKYFIIQRDIGKPNINIDEEDAEAAIFDKKYNITNMGYWWDEINVPDSEYKKMIFNDSDTNGTCMLANTGISIPYENGETLNYGMAYVTKSPDIEKGKRLGNSANGGELVSSYGNSRLRYTEKNRKAYIRVLVSLKPGLEFIKATDTKENAWDIKTVREEAEVKFSVTNYCPELKQNVKLSLEKQKQEKGLNDQFVHNFNFKEQINNTEIYTGNIKKYHGNERVLTVDDAKFVKLDNKYKIKIENIPQDYDYKIITPAGQILPKDKKTIDLDYIKSPYKIVKDKKLQTEYKLIIYPKNRNVKIPIKYEGGDKDKSFSIKANFKLKTGNKIIDNQIANENKKNNNIELKAGTDYIDFVNIPMFNSDKNELLKNFKLEYTKPADETKKHKITIKDISEGKDVPLEQKYEIHVKYVSDTFNIKTTVENETGNPDFNEIEVVLVTEKENSNKSEEFIKANINGTIKENLNKNDKDGSIIKYTVKKKNIIPGYIIQIEKGEENDSLVNYNIKIKKVLNLPYTGSEINFKNIWILILIIISISLFVWPRKKRMITLKDYKIMK